MHRNSIKPVFIIATIAGCAADEPSDSLDQVESDIGTTSTVPADGTCTHITATRFSDFQVSEYVGPLAGGKFMVRTGEHRVTATAYPAPCNQEPADAPWIADEQVATFTRGHNTLLLAFRSNGSVLVDPTFDEDEQDIVVGTRTRVGRNNEDAASPHFALDGWDVKQIVVPPPGTTGAGSETVLFSMKDKGGLSYSPRGLAAMPDGAFVAQLGEPLEPLRVFAANGAFLASWPVVYPAGTTRWAWTDGIEAVDANRLVRTGWLDAVDGNEAAAGIEILERATAADNSEFMRVVQQIMLPTATYPTGVAPIGDNYAVSSIDDNNELVVIGPDGSTIAGPTTLTEAGEGVFVTADGRLGVLDYRGQLSLHDGDTTARAGEGANYPAAAGISFPVAIATSSNQFVTLTGDRRVFLSSQTFGGTFQLPIDLGDYFSPSGLDYLPAFNQLAIVDRLPPLDAVTGTRIPTIDFYHLASGGLASSLKLQGVALPARTRSVAWVQDAGKYVTNYQRPGGVPDPIDTLVYLHNTDGSFADSFDIASLGFTKISTVNYLPATGELAISATDLTGTRRLLMTSLDGQPRRSYRTDEIGGFSDVTPINGTSDLGVVFGQPSEYVRISLPQ